MWLRATGRRPSLTPRSRYQNGTHRLEISQHLSKSHPSSRRLPSRARSVRMDDDPSGFRYLGRSRLSIDWILGGRRYSHPPVKPMIVNGFAVGLKMRALYRKQRRLTAILPNDDAPKSVSLAARNVHLLPNFGGKEPLEARFWA